MSKRKRTGNQKAANSPPEKSRLEPTPVAAARRRPLWMRATILVFLGILIAALVWTYRPRPRPETAITLAADRAEPEVAALLHQINDVVCTLVEQYPESPEAWEVYARAHYRLNEYDEAQKYWEQCLQLNPTFLPAMHAIALANLEVGNNTKAADYFRQAWELDPDSASFAVELSQALMADGNTEEAIEVLREDVRRHPRSIATLSMLGQALVQARQFAEAKEYLVRTIEIDPNFSNAYNNLVAACGNLGEEELAKQYAAKLKQLKAGEEAMHRQKLQEHDEMKKIQGVLGEMYAAGANVHLAHNEPARAEEQLLQAIHHAPNHVAPREVLTWLYQEQGRKEEAVATLRELRKIAPEDLTAQMSSGQLCAELGLFEEAEEAYRNAIALAPQQTEPKAALAWLYINSKRNLPEARKLAQQLVDQTPLAQHYYLLGVTCQINQDAEGARTAVAQAAALDPQNPEYQRVLNVIGRPGEAPPTPPPAP